MRFCGVIMQDNRATACDITDVTSPIETNTKLTSAFKIGCTEPNGKNACPTCVIMPTLLEFPYEWMPLHLIHDITVLVFEEMQNGLYKVSDCD